ncbi:hypothetical protein BBJ28_00020101 [Nothophytophthora sp. Chile5]|nr:hypothetical protein BBJ28_00020101 [Nothophytophthora sp. Chile5]
MRVDQRLESQRLLTESVRLKILRGVQSGSAETKVGFVGVQDALHRLDVKGDGYLDARVFLKKFLGHLKSPLTRPERDFLLEKLRAQSKEEGARNLIDYEQVRDYLMHHATPLERQNFEDLMEVLHEFQEGRETAVVDGVASKDRVMQPVANGVVLPLGEKLRVQIQFRL